MRYFVFSVVFILSVINAPLFGQQRALELEDIHRWKKIEPTLVSSSGRFVAYQLTPITEGDNELCLWSATDAQTRRWPRASEASISDDERWLAFRVKPALDSLKALRRKKVKEDDLPKDTLYLVNLTNFETERIPRLKSFALPEKWSGWLAVQLEITNPDAKKSESPKDTTTVKATPDSTRLAQNKPQVKPKKESKENGSTLLLRNLKVGKTDTVYFVRHFAFAEINPYMTVLTSGSENDARKHAPTVMPGLYHFDFDRNLIRNIWRQKGKYESITLDKSGTRLAWLSDFDTTKAVERPWGLYLWEMAGDTGRAVVTPASSGFRLDDPQRYVLNQPGKDKSDLRFSHDGQNLYFKVALPPYQPDTTLLKDEIVQVEVWSSQTPHLYTEMENRLEKNPQTTWTGVYHLDLRQTTLIADRDKPEMTLRSHAQQNLDWAIGIDEMPYAQQIQWVGSPPKDVYLVDLIKGDKKLVIGNLRCKPNLSPDGRYVYWWSEPDSSWYAWNVANRKTTRLTDRSMGVFYDEEFDTPDFPDEYGIAGWTEGDGFVLIYDRYDIWKVSPEGGKPERLTKGRENKRIYRYLSLDPEVFHIPSHEKILLKHTDEVTKNQGYDWLQISNAKMAGWLEGPYVYSAPKKARKSDLMLFTRQNIAEFPDLWLARIPSNEIAHVHAPIPMKISDANPQQSEYLWPSVELTQWQSLQGETLSGMIFKPANFDPNRQYPLLVYYYERMSDGLHAYRIPDFGRSSINPVFYASRGYVVFIPDIQYMIGYPGQSCYDAVMSGVNAITAKGYIDTRRMGLQGHSWGGYQTAWMVTRTRMFACAEAGAPVSNMTSAYGGIRWESGMNRQFQYEKQQSRIGGTLWERPLNYIDNSPLFALDRVETPLLILHNDEDGAVPWQQGIELFTGLRRLNKPVWLLNYNGEKHWPQKLQNRIDFQTRMLQFFDHYLMQKPMPDWMKNGVPPEEKGRKESAEGPIRH